MKLSIFLVITSFFIFGCAMAPKPEEERNAYYGPEPTNAESAIRDYMARALKDPASATYRIQGSSRKMWFGGGLAGAFKYGWGICAGVNAKNSFGGYVGEKTYFFLIQDEKVIHAQDAAYTKLCN